MRILVTGNMGYVGPVLVRHLRGRFPHAELVGFDAGLFGHCLTTGGVLPETLLDRQHFGDVRDFPAGLLEGVDAVVHLAAISNDPMGDRYAGATDEINRGASVRLAKLAAEAGVGAFVFASSCSVYGFAEGGARGEGDPVNPLTAYARSKVETERGLQALDNGRMAVTCLRFATACGMSDRLRLDLVLNDFVAGAVASGAVTVLSDGSPWRPLIDVADMARAIEWAIGRRAEEGGQVLVVNAGSGRWNLQVRELAEAVAGAIPGTRVSINTDAPPDRRSYAVDFGLFERLAPGHQPVVTLAESIARLRDGLGGMGFGGAGFGGAGYRGGGVGAVAGAAWLGGFGGGGGGFAAERWGMRFTPLSLAGVWLIELERREDARGWFARTFCEAEFAARGLPTRFPQCNASFNARRGTVRGLHWQDEPFGEGKLVRCTAGAVFDVAVDVRPGSASRGRWVSATLTAEGGEALYIPAGFAHGFQALADGTALFYQMTESYREGLGRGVRFDDPAVGVAWPVGGAIVSERDAGLPGLGV